MFYNFMVTVLHNVRLRMILYVSVLRISFWQKIARVLGLAIKKLVFHEHTLRVYFRNSSLEREKVRDYIGERNCTIVGQ